MDKCCLCNNNISKSKYEQQPLVTKFGLLCSRCVSRGHYENILELNTREQFDNYKRSIIGLN